VSKKAVSPSDKIRGQLLGSGLRSRKSLGQNFLVDDDIRDKIIRSAQLSVDDVVIEVGPGLGALTGELVKKAGRVIAVEKDDQLARRLGDRFKQYRNLQIVNADILEISLENIVKNDRGYRVVANIPYYITSPILHMFIHSKLKPSMMVVMMQKEVAEAVTAKPGKMSYISVSMQLFSKPEIVCPVPSGSFYPKPKVDSAVVKFNMLPVPAVPVDSVERFLNIVQRCFAAPRKQLRNSLALGLDIDSGMSKEILDRAGIDYQRRAETLSLTEWRALYLEVVVRR
jgi:16S rRNA (adenine1518-N6/adenine1519-N6)-dimethyltransferase